MILWAETIFSGLEEVRILSFNSKLKSEYQKSLKILEGGSEVEN